MAEDLKFIKGMFKDTALMHQIDGTFRDALNAVLDIKKASVTNEYGTDYCSDLYCNYGADTIYLDPVGQIILPNDNLIIFGSKKNATVTGGAVPVNFSAILLINTGTKETTVLYATTDKDPLTNIKSPAGDLNFSVKFPIKGEARKSPTGETYIYFTDNYYNIEVEQNTKIDYIDKYNPPRVFNVERQLEFLNESGLSPLNNLYSSPSKNVDHLDMFLNSGQIPEILAADVLEGGAVQSGAYYLGIGYADRDGTETNILVVTNPVYVVPFGHKTVPIETAFGVPAETQTNKNIRWTIANSTVNFDYEYIVPYIIQRVGNATFVSKLSYVIPKQGSLVTYITYTGVEAAETSSIDQATLDKVKFVAAKSITQIDNRIYLGNLAGRKDLGYQRFANSIKLDAVVKSVTKFDPRHYSIYNLNKGYAQMINPDVDGGLDGVDSSVLSRYNIIYKGHLTDYINTVIYPIQVSGAGGYRNPYYNVNYKSYRRGEIYAFYISFVLKDGSETFAYHIPGRTPKQIITPTTTSLDATIYESSDLGELINYESPLLFGFLPNEILNSDPQGKIFQYLDTSTLIPNQTMGYWHNANEFYPINDPNFESWETNMTGSPVQIGTIEGARVRHHKMPSNHNNDFSYIPIGVDYSNPPLTESASGNNFEETIRILGVKLSNIRIPKFILNQVQGYKIYYAKRSQADKTIIGQSGIHPATAFLAGNLATTKEDAKRGPYYGIWQMDGYQHKIGIIADNALWTNQSYMSQPVHKFHDFNLLKNKHTLAVATHIDIQYIVGMQHWNGGFKGAQLKKIPDAVSEGIDSYFYYTFRTGHGDSDYIWIHPALGNTVDMNFTEEQGGYDIWGPRVLWGSVYIGAIYNRPGDSNIDYGFIGDFLYLANGIVQNTFARNQSSTLNNLQTIFMIAPDSASYINGLGSIKNQSATAYHGATFLANTSGESAIALGLMSGVPVLYGYKNPSLSGAVGSTPDGYIWDYWAYRVYALTNLQSFWTGNDDPLNEVAERMSQGRDFLRKHPLGSPNIYLVNLCSKKNDIFQSFDKQRLVWTGVYQSLLNVDPDTGQGYVQDSPISPKVTVNYYSGATSKEIYGGDTFITRYSYRTTSQDSKIVALDIQGDASGSGSYILGDVPLDMYTGYTGDTRVLWDSRDYSQRIETLSGDSANSNWSDSEHNVMTSLYQFIVESDDNLNYRHVGDVEKGVPPATSVVFDKNIATEVLFRTPLFDLTKMDNLLYENHFSALQDIRVTVPLEKGATTVISYPNRVVRSLALEGDFVDKYRYFLALDYKDFPSDRGAIVNIFNLSALLHIHTEKSLFRAKGKQVVQLTDESQAYIGSGDLFAQEPEEMSQNKESYLGLQNILGGVAIKDGYVFISRKSKRIFLLSGDLKDLTEQGIVTWGRDNIPYKLEEYGFVFDETNNDFPGDLYPDAPTEYFGFIVSYDPLFRRVIITKRELVPTSFFISEFELGRIKVENNLLYHNKGGSGFRGISLSNTEFLTKSGWTISFSIDMGVWASRHSYYPPLYAYNSRYLYSVNNSALYSHSDMSSPGRFYGRVYSFEIDCIFTGEVERAKGMSLVTSTTKLYNKTYSNISFITDVYKKESTSSPSITQFSPGFTSFYVYNSYQISKETSLVNLSNIRKVEGHWSINDFRDMSKIELNNGLNQGQTNTMGNPYNGTYTSSSSTPMFLSEGVVNGGYIDYNKPWYEKKRFIDKYLGLRLICNNQAKNLVSLHVASAASRVSRR